mgnify:CR=1 FL=1
MYKRQTLTPERVEAVGIFRRESVAQVVHAHLVERKYELWSVWTALVFHLWYALYIDQTLTPESLDGWRDQLTARM